jgi:ABC-type uncharacterized transport system permease subunit
MPSLPQLALLFIAAAFFAGGVCVSFLQGWRERAAPKAISRALMVAGIFSIIVLILWHDAARGRWLPLGDNFDALLWLAAMLAVFVVYVQSTKPLTGLDWFAAPVVVLLLLAAAFVGKTEFHPYVGSTWDWVHRATSYGGAVAFAIAAATGAMYLINRRRLRSKSAMVGSFASLERLEHINLLAVVLGFAMLTIGSITGGVTMVAQGKHTPITKIAMTAVVLLVYAIVLHAPINPSFRGRKVAVLSIVGFVLRIGTIVAVLLMPGGVQ